MSFIEINNLSWRYSEKSPFAISNLNLTIDKGEFIGIMGATGSGKTTLALALRGLIPEFFEEGVIEGEIRINDIKIFESDANLLADVIGMVFQDASSQILGTTVTQDIAFGPSNLDLPKEEVLEIVAQYIERMGLQGKEFRSPDKLSGGEMQRLAAAGVMCMEPSVLVMDEPAAELDPKGKEDLCAILNQLRNEKGITVVLIEQDPELIIRFCDRMAILDKGELVLLGTPREVFSNTKLCIQYGVNPPEIVEVSQTLKEKYQIEFQPTPISSEELVSQILPIIKNKNGKNKQAQKPIQEVDKVEEKTPLFSIQNLTHTYSSSGYSVKALDNISFDIYPGEYITIIGSNGAGKTTLAKHLNGLLTPTSGDVIYNNVNLKGKKTAELFSEIGYCFQNPDHQIFSKSVYEEIAFGLVNLGMEEEEINQKVKAVLELVNLSGFEDSNPFNLGKGERQKIALASTIVLEPNTLVIDEPSTGLDWIESQNIFSLIDGLNKKGTTLIAITHDMRIVREYATRVIVMTEGHIIFDGKPYELISSPEIFTQGKIDMTPIFKVYNELHDYFPAGVQDATRSLTSFADSLMEMIADLD